MSFEQVSARAIDYAEQRLPAAADERRRRSTRNLKFFKSWPDNQAYWLKPDGSMYKPGETIKLPTLARHAEADGRSRARRPRQGPRGRHRRGARSLLQGRHRARDGRVSASSTTRRSSSSDFSEFFATIEEPATTTYRGYTVYKQAFGSQGPVAARDVEHPRELRPAGDGPQQRRLHPHGDRGDEARLRRSRHLLRRSGVRASAGRRSAVEGVREGARRADRSAGTRHARSSPAIRCRSIRR